MSSAGSVRPSRSLDNLRDVPDAEIYTDPDILAAGLVQIDTGDLRFVITYHNIYTVYSKDII